MTVEAGNTPDETLEVAGEGQPSPASEAKVPETPPVPQPQEQPEGVAALEERLKEVGGDAEDSNASPTPPNLNELNVEELGDEFISAQVQLLKSYLPDLDLDKALGRALEYGDKSLIDGFYIREVAGDRAADVVRHLESLYDNAAQRTQELADEIVQLAGGQERWQSAVGNFNAKASPGVKRIVRELLSSYNQKDYLEAAQVVLNFATTEGGVNQPADFHTPQAPASAGVDEPLTQAQYVEEIKKAQSIRDRKERHRVEEELASRRAASRRAGIN